MKRILSLFLAPALLLCGCGAAPSAGSGSPAPQGASGAVPVRTALAAPEYPVLPVFPTRPEDGGWEGYFADLEAYQHAVDAVRGDGIGEEALAALARFSSKSAAAALAGREGENTVYSPVSLWSALALAARCAEGDSRAQVLELLEASGLDELRERTSQVWRSLYGGRDGAALLLANSIWLDGNKKGTYVQETLDDLAGSFFAGAYEASMGTGEADRAVTEWISEQTKGLIGGSGEPVVQTTADTLALLVSTLYYKAGWRDAFQEALTQEDIFTGADGQESRVDFMHQDKRSGFLLRDGYQAAALSTQMGEMVFLLPDEGVVPESLLQDPDLLAKLDFAGEDARFGEVRWSVPKFDVGSDLGLKDALRALGVTDLLDPDRADLSALTDLPAYLSDAKQLGRVKVDEKGVEAAAATILVVDQRASIVPEDPEVCVMDLDRPFLFVIRDQGVPLFIGIVDQL